MGVQQNHALHGEAVVRPLVHRLGLQLSRHLGKAPVRLKPLRLRLGGGGGRRCCAAENRLPSGWTKAGASRPPPGTRSGTTPGRGCGSCPALSDFLRIAHGVHGLLDGYVGGKAPRLQGGGVILQMGGELRRDGGVIGEKRTCAHTLEQKRSTWSRFTESPPSNGSRGSGIPTSGRDRETRRAAFRPRHSTGRGSKQRERHLGEAMVGSSRVKKKH